MDHRHTSLPVRLMTVVFVGLLLVWLHQNQFIERQPGHRQLRTHNDVSKESWSFSKPQVVSRPPYKKGSSSQNEILTQRPVSVASLNLVYVIGVEGSGQDRVAVALTAIGKACHQHVINSPFNLEESWEFKRASMFKSVVRSYQQESPDGPVVIINNQSFPSKSVAATNESSAYDLEWLHEQIDDTMVQLKIVYVTNGLVQPTATSIEYAAYLDEEQERMNTTHPNVWSQVTYSSFAAMEDCPALIARVSDFMQWQVCDVERACEQLRYIFVPVGTMLQRESRQLEAASANKTNSQDEPIRSPAANETNELSKEHGPALSVRQLNATFLNFNTTSKDGKIQLSLPPSSSPPSLPQNKDSTAPFKGNSVSYLYIVGVEGTGHHGVTPAIATIARTCNYRVVYEDKTLRAAWSHNRPTLYQFALQEHKHARLAHTTKVLIIEDQSFPTSSLHRVSTPAEKKMAVEYNLEWIFNQVRKVEVDMKYLHLTRDFYRAVASHPEFDKGFVPHANVLYNYLQHIKSEYEIIERRAPGLWREVQYESFTHMQNCTALVSAVVEFMEWDDCDVEFACEMLLSTVHTSGKNRTVNATDYAYTQSLNTTLPIPRLDIAPRDSYNFTTAVSARKPFNVVKEVDAINHAVALGKVHSKDQALRALEERAEAYLIEHDVSTRQKQRSASTNVRTIGATATSGAHSRAERWQAGQRSSSAMHSDDRSSGGKETSGRVKSTERVMSASASSVSASAAHCRNPNLRVLNGCPP